MLFYGLAGDLVAGDANGMSDVFVRDLDTGTTALVSVNATGTGGGNGHSSGAGLSVGGRFVLFASTATDLVATAIDGNAGIDVFVRDLQAGTTTLVSATPAGVSGDRPSAPTAIAPSGRYVLFDSLASDLAPGDGYQTWDVFLRDLQAGVTELVSVNVAGSGSAEGTSLGSGVTANGRYVVFESDADDLVSIPTGGWLQVYVRDRSAGTTELVSVSAGGSGGGNGAAFGSVISADGRYVLFESLASDLVAADGNQAGDVFVRDRQTGATTLVSRNSAGTGAGNSFSFGYALSADGRYVLFGSDASDLVPNDLNGLWDVFRHDLQTGVTALVSASASGSASGNGSSYGATMSADGSLVVFQSNAPNLVGADDNGAMDVFLRDLDAGTTALLSTTPDGAAGGGAFVCCLAARGTRVAFGSGAVDLVADDHNGSVDVFAAGTGRTLPTLPFADGFEPGDLTAWASYQP